MPPRHAPPAMKRASSDAGAEAPGKRQRREADDVGPNLAQVRSHLNAIEALPEDARTKFGAGAMLGAMLGAVQGWIETHEELKPQLEVGEA